MGWKEISKQLTELNKLRASVGWHSTAKYPDGTPVALVASTQEYGNVKKNVPPRPTVRPAIAEDGKVWTQLAGQGIKAVALGNRTAHQVVSAIGEKAAGDVRKRIAEIMEPPLAESTQRARARQGYKPDKPLVRTGLMLSTCTSEVEKKE